LIVKRSVKVIHNRLCKNQYTLSLFNLKLREEYSKIQNLNPHKINTIPQELIIKLRLKKKLQEENS